MSLEGRGDALKTARCPDCHEDPTLKPSTLPVICCVECWGNDMVCASCMVRWHWRMPMHKVQVHFCDTSSTYSANNMLRNGMDVTLNILPSRILDSGFSSGISLGKVVIFRSQQQKVFSFSTLRVFTRLASTSVAVLLFLSACNSCACVVGPLLLGNHTLQQHSAHSMFSGD